jgi:hypothetical protein
VSLRTRGAVAFPAVLLLAGCSGSPGAVEIHSPDVTAHERRACTALLDALPSRLGGQDSREVTPHDALGRAWGDPPVTLTCGVGVPASFDRFSQCVQVDGVGWYVPEAQSRGGRDATFTAVGYRPRVALRVPAEDLPEGGAAALADLAGPVREHLELVKPCR